MTISNAEWDVMRVIWAQGETTSSQIITILSQKKQWSASTVKTLITRLADKGYISSRRQGKQYLYQALLSEKDTLENQINTLFERICLTKHYGLLEHLLEKTPMTSAEIQQLEQLLEVKRVSAVPKVICNCVPGQCQCQHHLEVKS